MKFFVLCILFSAVRSYPNGAPTMACSSMAPQHDAGPQTAPCPFRVVPRSNAIHSNEALQVDLQVQLHSFKGYLLMAVDEADRMGQPLGTFSDVSDGKVIDCSSGTLNAVTHANSRHKNSVTVTWTPPRHFNGSVLFKATFVQNFDIYWLAEQSSAVQVEAANEPTATLATSTSPPQTTMIPLTSIYDGCGQVKGCFGHVDCVNSGTCLMLVTFALRSNQLELEIYGQASGDSYVAVGFSKDNKMGDDSVTECVLFDGQVDAHVSFNGRGVNQRLPTEGLKVIETRYANGFVYCRLQRESNFSSNGINFNLMEPHFLLLARGPAATDKIEYHGWNRVASEEAVALGNFTVPESSGASLLIQLHGSLMVSAWLMAGSIGTFLPRYMKKTWVGKQLMGKDLWFFFHRGLMVKVWLLTVAAFVLIFVDVGGWVSQPIRANPHPLIGCMATGLAFIQPFMAALRPAPDAANRFIFNWAHAIVGYSTHILAIACIYLAVEMEAANLPFCTYWVLAAHTAVYVTGQLVFTLLARRTKRLIRSGYTKTEGDEPGSTVRQVALATHSLILVGLAASVIVMLALGRDRIAC